jgi:hypothetical protein
VADYSHFPVSMLSGHPLRSALDPLRSAGGVKQTDDCTGMHRRVEQLWRSPASRLGGNRHGESRVGECTRQPIICNRTGERLVARCTLFVAWAASSGRACLHAACMPSTHTPSCHCSITPHGGRRAPRTPPPPGACGGVRGAQTLVSLSPVHSPTPLRRCGPY